MIYRFNQWPLKFKVALFSGICVLTILGNIFILAAPLYKNIKSLQQKKTLLNIQWRQLNQAAGRRQQLLRDIQLLRDPYETRLQTLRQSTTPASLYTQIALLAKAQALTIITLKPQKNQMAVHLEQQILTISISGAEIKLLSFLRLLMHQSWLLEIQQIELTPMDTGVHLQATLAAYYDTH